MNLRTGSAALFALCASLGFARPSAAADVPSVVLVVPDCLGVAGEDVKKLVALELEPRMHVVADEETALVARVRCDGGAPLELTVEDPDRSSALRSELDLARTAEPARTRLLALTLAELIATSQLERSNAKQRAKVNESQQATKVAAAGETDSDAEPATTAEEGPSRTAWQLWLGPALSFSFAPTTPLFGADLGASRAVGPFAVSAEIGARFGEADVTDASVTMQTFSGALAIAPVLALGDVEIVAGAGVRGGYARLSAFALRSDRAGVVVDGDWFGPIGIAAVNFAVLGPSRLRIAFEAGYATRSVVGQDVDEKEDLVAMRGAWLNTTFAVGLGL